MENGFVKLWRKSVGSRVFNNEGLWKVWTWCLMKASHKKRWISIKTGKSSIEIEILKGQFIFGRDSASKILKMKPSTLWDRMKKLENMKNIDIKTNRQYSIVTIVNWHLYQSKENKTDSEADRQPTGNRQATDTNKNVENVENEQELITYPANLRKFAEEFILYIAKESPKKKPTGNILSKSLDTLDKLKRLDGFEEEYIFKIIRWAKKDSFWQDQLFSLAALRNKSNSGLTKFQNIVVSYDKCKKPLSKSPSRSRNNAEACLNFIKNNLEE